jgi:hypothetical protein
VKGPAPWNLTDRDDPFVVEALTKKCPLCKQPEGADCVSTLPNYPLKRLVHYCRAEKAVT